MLSLIFSGYEETRKKSGPKQGYVKKLEQKSQTLEQRLAQLEKLLSTHQNQPSVSPMNTHLPTPPGISPLSFETLPTPKSASGNVNQFPTFSTNTPTTGIDPNMFTSQPLFPDLTPPENSLDLNNFPLFSNDISPQNQTIPESDPLEGSWAWDLVSLGMQEELPPEDLTNKLFAPTMTFLMKIEQKFTSKNPILCFHFSIGLDLWPHFSSRLRSAHLYVSDMPSGPLQRLHAMTRPYGLTRMSSTLVREGHSLRCWRPPLIL